MEFYVDVAFRYAERRDFGIASDLMRRGVELILLVDTDPGDLDEWDRSLVNRALVSRAALERSSDAYASPEEASFLVRIARGDFSGQKRWAREAERIASSQGPLAAVGGYCAGIAAFRSNDFEVAQKRFATVAAGAGTPFLRDLGGLMLARAYFWEEESVLEEWDPRRRMDRAAAIDRLRGKLKTASFSSDLAYYASTLREGGEESIEDVQIQDVDPFVREEHERMRSGW
jgi:hypothetical protein